MAIRPWVRGLAGPALVVALGVLAYLGIASTMPPSPRPADAPAGEFSAGRAFAHVERISTNVHVAGSPAAEDVRSYIASTLQDLGLRPETQSTVGADDALGGFAMARVRNVVAVLPGTASTGRVFLVAHYDSVQVSHGANDDGAGVATLLETARALGQGPKPRNDIVFVFTDAEEACLCGAEAFVSQHPLARDGGVVINIEARGSSGPAVMFETSANNADIISEYADAAPYPVATSFAVEVYRILPNDTDFTPFRKSGRFTGVNAAYIDGSAVYHTPEDTASRMDRGSLQQHGDNALAVARAFGASDIAALSEPSTGDTTYFPVLGTLVRYPGWLVWPIAVLGLLAVGALAYLARRRGLVTWGRMAAGFGLGFVPLIVSPVAAQLLWTLLVALRPDYGQMIDPWQPGWFRAAVVALVAAVLFAWYGWLRRRFGPALVIGGLGWLAVLGLVLAAATPGGSYLAALPAIAASAGAAGALLSTNPWVRLGAPALGGVVVVLILAPTVMLFFPALGLETAGAAALFSAMLGLSLLPVLDGLFPASSASARPSRWRVALPGLTAGGLAVVFLATGLVVDRFDAQHPARAGLMYALDADTGKARWISPDGDPTEWTRSYVTGPEDLSEPFPLLHGTLSTGPAEAASLPAPALTVVTDGASGLQRTVTLRVTPQRAVRLMFLDVVNVKVLSATVAGRDVPQSAIGDRLRLLFHAPSADGELITLTLAATEPVRIRVLDGSDGLTGLPGFRPRPADVSAAGSHQSDLVVVAKTYTV